MKTYNEYKDTEIEWIGEIPTHWNLKKIKHTTYVKGRIGWQGGYTADIDQPFRGNMEMCSADI